MSRRGLWVHWHPEHGALMNAVRAPSLRGSGEILGPFHQVRTQAKVPAEPGRAREEPTFCQPSGSHVSDFLLPLP